MPGPEDKYTDRLRQAIVLASQEALRFRQSKAGPEHLMLGLLREGTGLATAALNNLGVQSDELRSAIEAGMESGTRAPAGAIELSAEAKKALALSAGEATRLKSGWIGQEHLLLALLRSSDNAVARTLADFHVTYELANTQITAMLRAGGAKVRMKRYNLALPEEMFRDVEHLASNQGVTVLEVLRRSVKLGLLVARAQETPGTSFIIREGGTERQLVLL